MEYAYALSGAGVPKVFKFQVNETLADGGIVVLAPGAGNAGVQISTTTSMANAVGVTLDTATYLTAQQTDGTSAEREVSVLISPDACFRALMSGGATEGTALTQYPITTASATGLVVTTASIANWASPDFDEGVVWFDDGANVEAKRKVTSVSGTAGHWRYRRFATVTHRALRDGPPPSKEKQCHSPLKPPKRQTPRQVRKPGATAPGHRAGSPTTRTWCRSLD